MPRAIAPSKALAIRARTRTEILDPRRLDEDTAQVLREILQAAEAPNTRRTYRSAIRYWAQWHRLRYASRLALPVHPSVAARFVADHLRKPGGGCALPDAIDRALCASGVKGRPGPLKLATIENRLYALSSLHRLLNHPSPTDTAAVRKLLSRARRAASAAGEAPRKVTPAARDALEAMLATCDDSLEGVRDRALLLFGFASGGRRRSEIAQATVDRLVWIDPAHALYRLGRSKTNQEGLDQPKPVVGRTAQALAEWIRRSGITDGPLFRRLHRNGRVGQNGLNPESVARIVRTRALRAGLGGSWAGHSLRSGYVTEAGRRGVPIGDAMAMTGHRSTKTFLGYYHTGSLMSSPASRLLEDGDSPPARPTPG